MVLGKFKDETALYTSKEMGISTDNEDVCPPAAKQPRTSIPSNSDLITEINNYEVDESSSGGVSQFSILKKVHEK